MHFRSDMTVQLIKHAAEDTDVTFAARVSTLGGETRYVEATDRDAGLIDYLMRERHGSPFEHTSFTFYIETPIFVAREFFRHRAGWSYNEWSGRYSELQPEFYVPDRHRKLVQTGKPGAYQFTDGSERQHAEIEFHFTGVYEDAWASYVRLLEEGIAREVARMVLPVGVYTSFYATCNARSLMHFLSLRTEWDNAQFPSKPQAEIQMVADQMEQMFAEVMPLTHEAFQKNRRVAP